MQEPWGGSQGQPKTPEAPAPWCLLLHQLLDANFNVRIDTSDVLGDLAKLIKQFEAIMGVIGNGEPTPLLPCCLQASAHPPTSLLFPPPCHRPAGQLREELSGRMGMIAQAADMMRPFSDDPEGGNQTSTGSMAP